VLHAPMQNVSAVPLGAGVCGVGNLDPEYALHSFARGREKTLHQLRLVALGMSQEQDIDKGPVERLIQILPSRHNREIGIIGSERLAVNVSARPSEGENVACMMRPLLTAYDPDLIVGGRAFAGRRYHGGGVESSRQDHFVAFFHQGIQVLHERSGINRVTLINMTSRAFPGALAQGTRVDRLWWLLGPDIAQANLLGGALWSSHSKRCHGDERRAGQAPHDRFHTSSHPCGDHDCATPRPFDSTLKIGAVNRAQTGLLTALLQRTGPRYAGCSCRRPDTVQLPCNCLPVA
jgi:hypothetical protein